MDETPSGRGRSPLAWAFAAAVTGLSSRPKTVAAAMRRSKVWKNGRIMVGEDLDGASDMEMGQSAGVR